MENEKSHMFVTGPEVIKTVTHEDVTKEELGGAFTHNSKSGVAHFNCADEDETLMTIRELLSFRPSNNLEDAPVKNTIDPSDRIEESLQELVPADPNRPYDMHEIIQ